MYLGNWLKLRGWEGREEVPVAAEEPEGFEIAYCSDEGDAWQRWWRATGQRQKAYHPRTGFYFERMPSRWPPGAK
jgi:hypothetical protein